MGKRDQVPRPPGGRPNVEKNKGGKRGARRGQKKTLFGKKNSPKRKNIQKKRKEKKRKEKKMNGGFYISPKPTHFDPKHDDDASSKHELNTG
jgi:hypothetical protein